MISGSSKMLNKEFETNSIIFSITTGYYPLEDFLYKQDTKHKQFLSNANTYWYIHIHVHIHARVYVYD